MNTMIYLHLLLLTCCLPLLLQCYALPSVRVVDSVKRRLRIPIYPVLTHFRDNNNTMWSEILGPPKVSTSKPAIITAASKLEINSVEPMPLESSELHASATNGVASVEKLPENPRTVITAKTGNFVVPVTPSTKRKSLLARLQRVTTTTTNTPEPEEESIEEDSADVDEEEEEEMPTEVSSTLRPNLVVVRQRLANIRLQTHRELKPSKNYISTDRESQLIGHPLKTKPTKMTSTTSSPDPEGEQEVTLKITQRPRLPQRFWTRTTSVSTPTTTTSTTTTTAATTTTTTTTAVPSTEIQRQDHSVSETSLFDEGVVVVQTELAAPSESHYYHDGEEDSKVVVVEASAAHAEEEQHVGTVNHNHFEGVEVAVPDVQVYGDKR